MKISWRQPSPLPTAPGCTTNGILDPRGLENGYSHSRRADSQSSHPVQRSLLGRRLGSRHFEHSRKWQYEREPDLFNAQARSFAPTQRLSPLQDRFCEISLSLDSPALRDTDRASIARPPGSTSAERESELGRSSAGYRTCSSLPCRCMHADPLPAAVDDLSISSEVWTARET